MEGAREVKLLGFWASPFSMRVEMALKLKAVPYEYVEEDLPQKSQLLLQYNPVHKLVPVLLHHGRPICESLVILEYIDETWKEQSLPSLLPSDPYLRARVRFWALFFEEKLVRNSRLILKSKGEDQRKAIAEFRENTKILEEGMSRECLLGGGKAFVNGQSPGFLEVLAAANSCWHKALEEMFGLELLSRESNPVLSSWLDACCAHEVVRSTLPDQRSLVAYAVRVRERLLGLQAP